MLPARCRMSCTMYDRLGERFEKRPDGAGRNFFEKKLFRLFHLDLGSNVNQINSEVFFSI